MIKQEPGRQRGPGEVTWVGLGGLSGPSPAAGRAARPWPVRSAPQKQHDEHDDSDEDNSPNTDIHDGLFPSFESPGIPGVSRVGIDRAGQRLQRAPGSYCGFQRPTAAIRETRGSALFSAPMMESLSVGSLVWLPAEVSIKHPR